MPAKTFNVGLVGVGNISPAYIKGCRQYDILNLTACADIDTDRARQVAAENGIKHAYTVDELLNDPSIDIVVNLTIPAVHAEVSLNALRAGKHVYSEKPLAISLDEAKPLMDYAVSAGLRVGCAPDTFLFAQHQTARKALDDGLIGEAVSAIGFHAQHGPEAWHPNPDFFYAKGAGPMLDMGPYYITCLVNLFGAAARVSGVARASFPTRTTKSGRQLPVTVPTHYTGVIEFASGANATLITSFDVWAHHLPVMEVYGAEGTLVVPDPNGYDPRDARVYVPGKYDWDVLPITYPQSWARGIGLADMAYAIVEDRPHRASGELAYHVLEIMQAFEKAYESRTVIELESTCERPALMPLGFSERALEAQS